MGAQMGIAQEIISLKFDNAPTGPDTTSKLELPGYPYEMPGRERINPGGCSDSPGTDSPDRIWP